MKAVNHIAMGKLRNISLMVLAAEFHFAFSLMKSLCPKPPHSSDYQNSQVFLFISLYAVNLPFHAVTDTLKCEFVDLVSCRVEDNIWCR